VPVCIAGMQRSGTSMVARLLQACGLRLGPEAGLQAADASNPDGYWENGLIVALNDAIRLTLAGIGFHDPWGWMDPRNSLTMPLWCDVVPDLQVEVCVRHPVEVADPLGRRNLTSRRLALALDSSGSKRP
jgi:hypothetical protein